MRLKNEKWQDIASKAGSFEGYEITHELLAEILAKIYWNTSSDRNCINRKLCISPISGYYGQRGIVYAVEGSPPKGSIYIPDAYVLCEIFYYERGSFKAIWKFKKYQNVCDIAATLAHRDLDEIKNKTKT